MDNDLDKYLADQSAAISPDNDQEPQSRDDPDPTDADDDEEMPDDEESPGDDTDDEEDDSADESESEEPVTAGPDPRLAEIEQRAAAAERRALELESRLAAEREFARLQTRWAQMDPDDVEQEKAQIARDLMGQQHKALQTENETLKQRIQHEQDLKQHKPKAIAFLAEKHALTAAERAQLDRYDDPNAMTLVAEAFADARKVAERDARRQRKEERLRGGKDRIGTTKPGSVTTPPESTGNPMRDYLNQQKQAAYRR